MKIAVAFLLVAFSCYFNLASASCMSRCANSCQQTYIADVTCLQRALAKNKVATIRAIANVLCAYDRSKAMRNKMELIKALRLLQEPTRCDLLRGFTMEELNSDVDNTMQDALWTLVNVLSPLNVGYLSTPLCGPLGPLVAKITQKLYTRGISSPDGIWNVAGINGGKRPLGTVTNVSPGLVNLVLKLLLGDKKGLLGGVTGTVGGLTSAVTDLTGSTTRLISDLLGGLTGSIGDIAGGLTNSVGGLTRSIGGITGGLTNSLGGVTGLIGGITGGLTNKLGGVTGSIDGITGGLTNKLGGLTGPIDGIIGGLTSSLGGLTEPIGDIAGGLTSSLGGLTEPIGDIAGGLTNSLGGLTGSIDGITGGLTSSHGGLTGSIGGIIGGYGNSHGGLTGSNAPIWDMTGSNGGITKGLFNSLERLAGSTVESLGELTSSVESMTGLNGDAKYLSVNPGDVLTSEGGNTNGRIYANGEVNGDSYGGRLTGGISGRFFARPSLASSVSPVQQNPGNFRDRLQGGVYGDFAGGIGSYPARNSYPLYGA